MLKKIIALSTILLVSNNILCKKITPDQSKEKEVKIKNIKTIVNLTVDKESLKQSMQLMVNGFQQAIFEKYTDEKFRKKIIDAMNKFFDIVIQEYSSAEVVDQLVKMYDEIYTSKETEELLKFYQSPVGKKTIKKLPEIMGAAAMIMNTVMQKHLANYVSEVQAIEKEMEAAKQNK